MGYLWDRNLDEGNGEVKETEIPLDDSSMHVSQFDRDTNSRNSWDTNGSDADQNRTKGSSGRH